MTRHRCVEGLALVGWYLQFASPIAYICFHPTISENSTNQSGYCEQREVNNYRKQVDLPKTLKNSLYT